MLQYSNNIPLRQLLELETEICSIYKTQTINFGAL